MSDTSVISRGYRRRQDCWTRIGANVCVAILILTNIILAGALLFVIRRQTKLARQASLRKQAGNAAVNIGTDVVGHIFDVVANRDNK